MDDEAALMSSIMVVRLRFMSFSFSETRSAVRYLQSIVSIRTLAK